MKMKTATKTATEMADDLDRTGNWDWADTADGHNGDRFAVVTRGKTHYVVYRGSEADEATPYRSLRAASRACDEAIEAIEQGKVETRLYREALEEEIELSFPPED